MIFWLDFSSLQAYVLRFYHFRTLKNIGLLVASFLAILTKTNYSLIIKKQLDPFKVLDNSIFCTLRSFEIILSEKYSY